MGRRRTAAGLLLLLAATTNCAGAAVGDDDVSRQEAEAPLDLSVDRVDVLHGSLRVTATMHEGSAESSVRLGPGCDPREVGGGMATPSRLVWILSRGELAASLRCGLVVMARVTAAAGSATKVASMPVAFAFQALDSDDAPPPLTWSHEEVAAAVVSGRPLRVGEASFQVSLSVAGTALEAEEAETMDDVGSASD
jgi:hypothetical protein